MSKRDYNTLYDTERIIHPVLRSFQYGEALSFNFKDPICEAMRDLTTEGCLIEQTNFSYGRGKQPKGSIKSASGEELGTMTQPNIEKILSLSKPSPFGHGEETVYDENVRKGREIVAADFTIGEENELLDRIKSKVIQSLFPKARDVTFRRYKMAIYEEGGHFDFHRDTVHAENHRATLLLEVRSPHKGGKFIVRHGDKQAEFDLSSNSNGYYGLKWAVFYTDMEHKVEPVTEGHRIVIQYDVNVEDKEPKRNEVASDEKNENGGDVEEDEKEDEKDSEEDDEDEGEPFAYNSTSADEMNFPLFRNEVLNKVIAAIDKYFEHHSRYIALPLYHLYTTYGLQCDELKVVDRELFDAILASNRYEVALAPITVKVNIGENGVEKDSYKAYFTDPVTMWYKESQPVEKKSHATELAEKGCEYFVSMRESVREISRTSYVDHVGNEAMDGMIKYYQGVLVVRSSIN